MLVYNIFSLFFGACFGSFITMLSYRLPRNEDIVFKKSYCPKCNQPIKLWSLIPILSWVFQGGKCSNCGARISIRYPLIEIATAIMFYLSYLKFGVDWNTIIFDMIIVVCFTMFISDLETYILPDSLQVSLLVLSLAFIFYNHFDILQSVISAFLYFIIIYITAYIVSKWKKKDSLGGGDVKFIVVAGLILGLNNLTMFLFLAGLFGIIFGLIWKIFKKNDYFPFAPALIFSYLLLIYFF